MKLHIDRNADRLDYRSDDRPSDKEIRQDIIEELKKYTCSESEAEDFFEWIEEEGWQNYDGIDRWVNGRKVVETKTLYKTYCNG